MRFFLSLLFVFSMVLSKVSAQTMQKSIPLKMISFNIRMSYGKDSINIWDNRKGLVSRTLQDENADIIGMQEVTSEQYLFLKEHLHEYSGYAVGRKDGLLEDEIAVLFYKKKFQVMVDSTIWLSESPATIGSKSWDAALYRTVSWLTVKDTETGIAFSVYNTHFDHRGSKAREESAKLIMKLIASTGNNTPVVLMGDFNITEDEEPYKIITSPWRDAYSFQNAKSLSRSPHQGGNVTYNGFRDNFGRIIDFIFVSDGITVNSHRYLNVKEDEIFISDHYPVVTDLEIFDKRILLNFSGVPLE